MPQRCTCATRGSLIVGSSKNMLNSVVLNQVHQFIYFSHYLLRFFILFKFISFLSCSYWVWLLKVVQGYLRLFICKEAQCKCQCPQRHTIRHQCIETANQRLCITPHILTQSIDLLSIKCLMLTIPIDIILV